MASLSELLRSLGVGRLVPILTRRGGGLGDPRNLRGALARNQSLSEVPADGPPPVALDTSFDDSRMIPFVSSNVEGGYFDYYQNAAGQKMDRGNMFLLFQKRRPETPGGKPIGPPRAYFYENVPEAIWDAIFEASSHGGAVHDLVIGGGIAGDRVG